MARYDEIFAVLAERAVRIGTVNIETFIEQGRIAGLPREVLLEQLEADLENDGPIFGSFLRSMVGASTASVAAAARQGEIVGIVAGDADMRRLMGLADSDGESIIERALTSADPKRAAEIEAAAADKLELVWVAELRNTCHLCLPLHGKSRTLAEWQSLGLHPDTIHPGNWTSVCHCRLVPRKDVGDLAGIVAPLVRVKAALKGSKRTARSTTQQDLDRATRARDAALDSDEGRRVLRLLGEANSDA